MTGFAEFDPTAPLPAGTTVLEASAGTGKTHAVAALAVRLIADGDTTIDRLLMVTFGRNATRELRSRVREQLLKASAVAEPGQPQQRLAAAVAGFDAARVMTIHEFCAAMYAELGVLAAADPSAGVIADLRPLVREVAHDLYVHRYAFDTRQPPFALGDAAYGGVKTKGAVSLADDAVRYALRPIVPTDAEGIPGERVGFAAEARRITAERRRDLGVVTFDDQLVRLRDSLADPVTGAASRARLRQRFDAVLVDEFQDTDPVQWEILRRLFDGHRRMVLIGDPKQAIYTFRGADIAAYTHAVAASANRFSLSVNRRSDAALVEGLGELFAGLQLGEAIEVHPVLAHRPGSGVRGDGVTVAPVTVRTLDDEQRPWPAHQRIRADLVRQVRFLLSHQQLADDKGWRPVLPGDIAVLVRTNRNAGRAAEALRAAGVPVALSGADSIYTSPAAKDWLTLLRALASQRRNEVRQALVSTFFGLSLAELATADDGRLADWTATLRQWDRVLVRSGVAALFASIGAETTFIERVLSRADGERMMTDFRHVAEVLHEASGHSRPTAAWLAEWLQRERQRLVEDERTRRLETDAEAVQVKTVHGAKGLQYPIVLLPDLWDPPGGEDDDGGLRLHDQDGRAVIDLGGRDATGRNDRWRQADAEDAEEELRLLYVAFTRARSQVIAWWARTFKTQRSALQRVLYRPRSAEPAVPASSYSLRRPPGSLSPADLPWMKDAKGVRVAPVTADAVGAAPTQPQQPVALRALRFDRVIDADWRRTSYSGLTAGVHAEAPLLADEPDEPTSTVPSAIDATPSPMRDLPGGTQFGTLVHALFEQVDPGADRAALRSALVVAATEWLPRFPLPGVTPEALADALLPAFATPLGPLADDRSLAELPIGDRLAELSFDLPMAPAEAFTLGDLAGLMRRHLPAVDPLVGYPALLADPALADQPLKGFLTGSIDAVFRVGRPEARFLVVDYKTNRLGGEELTLGHYAQGPMVAAMCAAHYPLQALLYCVALHRFLAGRLPGYDPAKHLGGVLYLFVRGMGGPEAGARTGVFAWHPPAALVEELSRVLGGVSDD